MRSLTGPKNPDGPADPIIVHPDVRRMLLTQKAFAEGSRGFPVLPVAAGRYRGGGRRASGRKACGRPDGPADTHRQGLCDRSGI